MLCKNTEMYLWHGVNSVVLQTGKLDYPSYFTKLINEARIGVMDSYNNRSELHNKKSKVPGLILRLKVQMCLADGLYRAICIAEDNPYKRAGEWVATLKYADEMMKDVLIE